MRRAPARGLPRTSAAGVALALGAVLAAGCAKPGFPPGGPVDTIPPQVLLASPADSSVRVPRSEPIEIAFSEGMDRSTVRDGLRIYPPVPDLSLHWSGRRLRVTWSGPLEEATTYQLVLSAGARDLHGVILGAPLHIRFSTGDSLDPGAIRGVLRARTLATKNVPMVLYKDSAGVVPDFANRPPLYATETDTAGAYAFTALRIERDYTVHALYDRNRDGYIDPETDLAVNRPGVIRLTPERAVADSINLIAVDPLAPAVVSGTIAAPDSTARYRVEARPDSAKEIGRRVGVERLGRGAYVLRVPPGRYRLVAIRLAGPGGFPPRLELPPGSPIEARPEAELPGQDFEFPTWSGGGTEDTGGPPPEGQE